MDSGVARPNQPAMRVHTMRQNSRPAFNGAPPTVGDAGSGAAGDGVPRCAKMVAATVGSAVASHGPERRR